MTTAAVPPRSERQAARAVPGVLDIAADTFPRLLLANARRLSGAPAYRFKDLGIWQTWTWAQVRDEVRDFALGLHALGIARGDKIAIVGTNRPRLYWTFIAAQSLGAIPVPVYSESVADELAYVLDHAEIALAVVEDQEQVDKLTSIADRVPTMRRLVYDDPRGLQKYDRTRLDAFTDVQALGRSKLSADASLDAWWLGEIARGQGSDVSVMLYTSGTTGRSKGVMLSAERCIAAARDTVAFDCLAAADVVLAYLPLAWVGDHYLNFAQSMVAGFCIACPESQATVENDLREIGPTFYFAPPRVFENLLTRIMIRIEDAGRVKRWLFHRYIAVARRWGERILDGERVPLWARLDYALGDLLIYAPLKNVLGFARVRVAYTAGEAIGPELFSFYRSLGMNLKQLYGQTEAFLYITAQPDGQIRADTVGPPAPDVEISIADSGEVQYRSPGQFVGYFKDPDKTAETMTPGGLVRTGDAGFFDERGHLKIIDRAADVGKLSDGSLFAPKYIENKLKFFPEIKEAVAFGRDQPFVTAFVNIDLTAVASWAERNGIVYASYQELSGHPRVAGLIGARVAEVNRTLSREPVMAGAQVARFLVLPKELDADDGELTRTQKVRRAFIADRYAALVKALYDGSKQCHVDIEVTFEDGQKGRIAGDVAIIEAERVGDGTRPAAPTREAAA